MENMENDHSTCVYLELAPPTTKNGMGGGGVELKIKIHFPVSASMNSYEFFL